MNAPATFPERPPVKLTVPYFLLLRSHGAFDEYRKTELLDGEIWGVPADGDEEPESDRSYPIKLTTELYELLDRAGAFADHHGTELIDGVVYAMSPQYRPHGYVKDELAYRLRRALEMLGSLLHVATEQSVELARYDEPQPDIILTSEPVGSGPIPGASVALLVEVADSTTRFDLIRKAVRYAAAGVPEYWVVDVNARVVHIMWTPERGGYADRDKVNFGEPIPFRSIADLSVGTQGL